MNSEKAPRTYKMCNSDDQKAEAYVLKANMIIISSILILKTHVGYVWFGIRALWPVPSINVFCLVVHFMTV